MNIKGIVLNTFKEAARNKIFYLLIVFGVLFALSSHLIGLLTIGNKAKVIKDVGLAAIHFFSVLITIFTGINLVYKEIDKKTIYTILSKPISRDQFIIGKFAGLALTMAVALSSMALIFFVFLWIETKTFPASILIFFLMLYLELLVLIALSLLFSSFSTPILSSIFAIVIYLIGQVLWTYQQFRYLFKEPLSRYLLLVIYWVLPNFYKFNIKNQIVLNQSLRFWPLAGSIAYGIVYIFAILMLTILIFRKRNFQ